MKYKVIAIHHIVVKSTSLKAINICVHRFINAVSIFIMAEIWHPEIQAEYFIDFACMVIFKSEFTKLRK